MNINGTNMNQKPNFQGATIIKPTKWMDLYDVATLRMDVLKSAEKIDGIYPKEVHVTPLTAGKPRGFQETLMMWGNEAIEFTSKLRQKLGLENDMPIPDTQETYNEEIAMAKDFVKEYNITPFEHNIKLFV